MTGTVITVGLIEFTAVVGTISIVDVIAVVAVDLESIVHVKDVGTIVIVMVCVNWIHIDNITVLA